MIKTQIQLPDALYQEVKRVAREREISLAEVLRRGAEYITLAYPPVDQKSKDVDLPGPFNVGLAEDPFSNPDWRYNLHERVVPTARERRGNRYGKRGGKKK
jgi:hypothetical protein